ncbi:Tautomerase/MIF superfamily [Pilobolus umbonatus]|nr:Tautomerase/MIF superfamily [Pilobolus umbonatus]
MPILEITTAESHNDIRGLTKKLSVVFAELIGKPESYCLVTFQKVDSFFFAGSDKPGYLAKVGSIGHIDNTRNAKLSSTLSEILQKELNVPNDRAYIIFTDVPAENIGFRGDTFANLLK